MKAYNLALFLLILQVSAVVLTYGNIFPGQTMVNTDLAGQYETDVKNANVTAGSEQGLSGELEALNKGLSSFLSIGKALFNVENTFMQLGIPEEARFIASTIAGIVYLIWVVGLVQFLRNSSFEVAS